MNIAEFIEKLRLLPRDAIVTISNEDGDFELLTDIDQKNASPTKGLYGTYYKYAIDPTPDTVKIVHFY